MKVEVKVVSKEIIKPSFPTQDHLRSYQLSFLDQISPPVYNPFVMFYSLKGTESKFNCTIPSLKIKKSLSDVLTLFYLLAGRVKENLLVDCNDEGIPYLETQVNCQLSDIIQNPNPNDLNKFIPFLLDDVAELALGVQLNTFECGGIAIGCCVSHKIADALSSFMFLKSWAANTAQEVLESAHGIEVSRPQFVSATLFPPKNISGFDPRVGMTSNKINNVITKRFVFNASAIETIRAKYNKGLENQKRPSRVEALSAFIWSRFVAATRRVHQGQDKRLYAIVHAVNLRTRIDPPLPENSFGNLYRIAMTIPRLDGDEEESCFSLVKQMREQISRVDKEYVRELQQGIDHLSFIKKRAKEFLKGEMVSLNFTSLCRFPLYDCDFGWGKPVWVGAPPLTFKNLVVFMDTKFGHGIEAYVNLEEDDMAEFQSDNKLLAFVSPTEVA